MFRVFQDVGIIDVVDNQTVEHILCVAQQNEVTTALKPELFWLKTYEAQHWHRFFLDAGIAFWSVYSKFNEEDCQESTDLVIDLGKGFDLVGVQIRSIEAYRDMGVAGELPVSLRIQFSDGHKLPFHIVRTFRYLIFGKKKIEHERKFDNSLFLSGSKLVTYRR